MLISYASKRWSPEAAWNGMWLMSAAFFLLALPALIPIKPMTHDTESAMALNGGGGERVYRKAVDYRRGGMGGRY